MRLTAAIGMIVMMTTAAWAQSNQQRSSGPYPWRSVQSRSIPAPPSMQRKPILSSAPVQLQSPQTQPAVSDAQQYDFDNVPQAPADSVYYQPSSPEPGLAIESTSQAEPDYCLGCELHPCDIGCPKRLFGCSHRGLQVGGWADFGYHNRDTLGFNNRKGTVNTQQLWLFFDRAASQSTGFWDIGYRFDALYGIDGPDVQAFGNSPTGDPEGWDNDFDHGAFGWALPQAYGEIANERWRVKIGKFLSPLGYEQIPAVENFFYSHSYTRYFNQPFTMTGILAERTVGGNCSLIGGFSLGWDTAFERNRGGFNAITGLEYRPHCKVALKAYSSLGDTGYRGTGIVNSLVADFRLRPRVNYVTEWSTLDLQDEQYATGWINYLYMYSSPCLKWGTRLEWWKSNELSPGNTRSTWEWTVGANWRPNANIVVRPELRLDWGAAALDPGAVIIGIDAIMIF